MTNIANNIIIVEGANCTGKSTLSQILQLKIKYSLMVKLAPSPNYFEKLNGNYEKNMYYQTFELIKSVSENNVILDRYFFSEYVYSQIYKEYTIDYFNELVNKLDSLNRNIYVILLTTSFENMLLRINDRKSITNKDEIYGSKNLEIANEYLKAQKLFIEKFDDIKGINIKKLIYNNDLSIENAVKTIMEFVYEETK